MKTKKKGTHGELEQTFEELDLQGQSRVINAQIQILIKSIRANLRTPNSISITEKDRRKLLRIKQLQSGIIKIIQI